MKTYTNEEIQKKMEEIFNENNYEKLKIEVSYSKYDANEYRIKLSKMYSAPGLSFAKLHQVALYFDTMNVETESEFANGGCDTCDYGSSYGFTLCVRNGDSPRDVKID